MLVFLIISLLGVYEFYKLQVQNNIRPQLLFGLFLASYLFISISLFAHKIAGFELVLVCLPLSATVFIIEMYRKTEQPFTNIAYTLLGAYYVALPLALLNFFFSPFQLRGEFNTHIILGFFIITWFADTMAYLVGTAIGRHRLFERVSPKKSWEGMAGAIVAGVLSAYVLSLFFKDLSFCHWAIISLIIVVVGTYGDLAESLLKRSVNVKDSGSIMPGHGGILDRFDGVLFSAVFVFVYIYFFIAN